MRTFPDKEMWPSGKRYASKGRTYRLGRGGEKRTEGYLACRLLYITCIRLPTNFVYLACILDAYSRKCIGWKLSRRIDTQLALDALEMALVTRQMRPGLIHQL